MTRPERGWTREQLLIALRTYCTLPFGKLHQRNPTIISLAKAIERSPSALAMKACNFASLDPTFLRTNRRGLGNASDADRALWTEFERQRDQLMTEAEELAEALNVVGQEPPETVAVPMGPSEVVRPTRVRRLQRFFSNAVRSAYDDACAVTGLKVRELVVASHIVPWAVDPIRRADPTNGVLLDGLLDRAFDAHLITFDDQLKVVCSRRLRRPMAVAGRVLAVEGAPLRIPRRFRPDPTAIESHRRQFFEMERAG